MKRKFSIFHIPYSIEFNNLINLRFKWKMINGKWKTPQGFTLFEIILAVTIIAIVGTSVLFIFNPLEQIRKANDTKRKSDLGQLQRALEVYYQDFGRYPESSDDFKLIMNSVTVNWGSSWAPYMARLPLDPVSVNNYIYYSPVSSDGQTYYLYANLERGNRDPQVCNAGEECESMDQSGFPAANACGGICNYGLSSSNVTP